MINGYKFTTLKLTRGNQKRINPVKRLHLPNGTEWHNTDSSQFEV